MIGSGAVLARSSQPLVGLMMNMRCNACEKLVVALCAQLAGGRMTRRKREQCGVSESCGCLWAYLADLRSSEGRSHAHYNFFYDPLKHDGPVLPPASALVPTLWPQFRLRWACPTEAQDGEVEAFELQKVKDFTYVCSC
ncbi:hypothetical protein Dsin_000299 [Dipteronia sinensis]|uniref:Uncharacterized protein n=1 Tax=Dipteronia sinensis TaxID=43782 RepID=A0AAE0B1T3_9ROSI|nr:hypothetical protein Dsin_000299 [Dipteronia sinensis]